MAARRRPMISMAAATGLIALIDATGRDADEILRPLGLERKLFATTHGFMAAADFARLLEDAARLTGDECFGLHFGERYQPKDVGALAYVVLNSPTMAMAFDNVVRYLRVHNEAAEVSFVRDGRWAYLRARLDLPLDSVRQHAEYSMAVGLNTIRLMAGSTWAPVEVQFEHKAPSRTAEHLRAFSAPIAFGCPTNAFVIEPELAERQIPAADARLYPIMQRHLDRVLEAMPVEDDLQASVRRAIGESMRHGDPKLTDVASKLAIGPRTLQRRLREYDVDFKRLVEDTRRRFALRYLEDPDHTLTEVAYLLGYSEVSAFNRAFRRWTGSTPSDYRRGAARRSR